MKWFKTRKDKRIEELEREIEQKNKAIEERDRALLWNGSYSVRQMKPQIIKIAKRYRVSGAMNVESTHTMWREELAEELAKRLIPLVTFKMEYCGVSPYGYDEHNYELYGRIVVMKEDDDEV